MAQVDSSGATRRRNDKFQKRPCALSGAFLPGSEVLLLFGGKLVEAVAHGLEFELRDLAVNVLRNDIDLWLQFLVVLHQVFGGQRLIREAHIHHGGRVTFGGGEVYKATFADEIDLAAVLELEFVNERPNFALAGRESL